MADLDGGVGPGFTIGGRVTDPLIGRDLLASEASSAQRSTRTRSLPDLMRPGQFMPTAPPLTMLMTWSGMIGTLISVQAVILAALLFFLMILLLRLIVRTDRWTVVAYLLFGVA